jgi:5'-methylthioadenosine phosphorylase
MTALPEAKLAREAEICYAAIAGITDYDCWQRHCDPIPIDVIIETLRQNTDQIREIIKLAVASIPDKRECACATALKETIITDPRFIPAKQRQKLDLLIGKYLT